jgi:hypothetical protein
MTNHKWNILNIMRFYNRIGEEFNGQVYTDFIGSGWQVRSKAANVPNVVDMHKLIRRHIANGWCVRDENAANNVLITPKGVQALRNWEMTRVVPQSEMLDCAHGVPLTNLHRQPGSC